MRQLDLTYKPAHAGRDGWQAMLEALRSAVAHLSQKEVCFTLDVSKSTLSEALSEKNDKRWANEWTFVVLAMLTMKGDDKCRELGRAILDAQIAMMPCFALSAVDDVATAEEIAYAEALLAKAKRRAA